MTLTNTPTRDTILGYSAAFGAALCYGSVAVVARKIVNDFAPPLVGTAFSMLFGTIVVVMLFARHAAADYAARPAKKGWLFVVLAGFASTWGVTFWFLALSQAPVVLVAPIAATHPLVSVVLSHLFLQRLERVTARTVAGTVLVIGGVILITLGT
jgi:drug/metabolite transporter (DMT)-like permease